MHGTYRDTYNGHNNDDNTYDGHDDDDNTYNMYNGRGHIQQPQHMRWTQRPRRQGQQRIRQTHTTATTMMTGTADAYSSHNNNGAYNTTD
ncbi:hypothetical protein CVT25_007072, partial [Psilocybe cyanescens]